MKTLNQLDPLGAGKTMPVSMEVREKAQLKPGEEIYLVLSFWELLDPGTNCAF